jgi:hypothetical protein
MLFTHFCFALQALRDLEERPEGEVNDYNQLAAVTEKLRANVNALFMSRAYYLSHVYNRASSPQPSAGMPPKCTLRHVDWLANTQVDSCSCRSDPI